MLTIKGTSQNSRGKIGKLFNAVFHVINDIFILNKTPLLQFYYVDSENVKIFILYQPQVQISSR